MKIDKGFFEKPTIERLKTESKLLLIYLRVLTDVKSEYFISWERMELDTGLIGSDLDKAFEEIKHLFKWEEGKLIGL